MSGSTDSETYDRTTQDRGARDTGVPAPEARDRDEQDQEDRRDREDQDPGGRDREDRDAGGPDRDEDHDPAGPDAEDLGEDEDGDLDGAEDLDEDPEARRARWTAVATGVLLTVAGLAASVMRTAGSGTALIPLSYASGAVLCAGASALGARGRTRRALWLMIVGVMVMAVGDQLD